MNRKDLHTIYSDVTECSCAVILNVGVGRCQQADEDRDGACVDELLSVLV